MKTLAMILAGGRGSRLDILSLGRAKPSVPFAGKFRIIDFVLSQLLKFRNIRYWDFNTIFTIIIK